METSQMLRQLVKTLIETTREGRVEWAADESDGPDSDTFMLSLTRGSVFVWSVDNDGAHPFVFQVRGARGQVVERIETTRPFEEGQEWTPLEDDIRKLYDLARRSALNIDEVLTQMINDLRSK
ncbi:hypothetical protein ABT133_16385 [Streptomyces sp. NPDC001835]|uniref:hypothetical protein n=1 Tax=Streptomyces sp. NPDC001835 TaxID=3154528 RepID=UPI00331DB878